MGKSLLVADDNEEIIKFLKPYLIKEGFEVNTRDLNIETTITAETNDQITINIRDIGKKASQREILVKLL